MFRIGCYGAGEELDDDTYSCTLYIYFRCVELLCIHLYDIDVEL